MLAPNRRRAQRRLAGAVLLLVGVIFVVGGYAEWRYGYLPVFDWLNHRYPP